MTTLATTTPGWPGPRTTKTSAQWQHELTYLSAVRTFYEKQCGWPVAVEPRAGRVSVTTGTALDALVMPSCLGEAVGHALIEIMQPTAAFTSGDWWTFLTLLRPTGATLPKDLVRARVRLTPDGSPVPLPMHQGGWVLPPIPGRGLPPHSVVVNIARRVRSAVTSW